MFNFFNMLKTFSRHMVQLALLFLISVLPLVANGQATGNRQINMPQLGKLAEGDITVAAGEEITFYDPWGVEDIKATNSYNCLSAIVFKPAEKGYAIQVTFSEIDLDYFSDSYPLYLNVYDGIIDADNSYEFPTATNSIYGINDIVTPTGTLLATLKGTMTDKSFISSDPSGALSFFMHHRNSNACKGWVATVKAIQLVDMSIKESGASYEGVVAEPTKKTAINLGGFYVTTEGLSKALTATSVSFKLPVNECIDVNTLKVYEGVQDEFSSATPIESTLSNNGDVYTLTFNKVLTSGRNNFSIAGNVKADAKFGSKAKLIVEKVTTKENPEGLAGFKTATPVEVRIPFIVLMGAEHKTFSVGKDNVMFFDDGGKDGKISSKYEGTITFVPTTPGSKVQIDFKVISLYESSYTTTYNDLAFVYNGTAKNDAALNEQLHNANPIVVKSSSEDGALTVYLKSVTGDYSRGEGFEAVVSEYTPTPMIVKNVETKQFTTGTILAGETNQAILDVDIQTENTLAVNAESFSFNIDGTTVPSHLKRAKLFYTGKSKDFATDNMVADIALNGEAKFTVSGLNVKLVEGSNHFWLAFDIDPQALTGEFIDAGCSDVTIGGKKTTVTTVNPEGNRQILNAYESVKGTFEKTVYGTWIFRSEKNPLTYYDGYNPVKGEQITTFIPGSADKIIEIDFSKFKVYYGTGSYDTQAKFEIYSGRGTQGELLWALTDPKDKNVGPGRIIRSKSADGALTVIFDPNTTSSSYTAEGFEAEVREYKSKPMVIDSINVVQASTSIIPVTPVAKNQEIIGFSISASGDQNQKLFEGVTLNLKGCQDKVEKVYLYTSGTNDQMDLTAPIAEIVPAADNAEAVMTLARPITINEGTTYYWVAYDLKADLATDTQIDAAVKSLQLSGEQVAPKAGDPEGVRLMKNILIMKAGENGEVTVGSNSLLFYDEGGIEDGITRSFEGTITFAPKTPGKAIKLILHQWNIGGSDKMYVYFGCATKANEDLLIKSTKQPKEVISFSEDGKITLKFKTVSWGGSSGLSGWEIEVVEYEIQPLSLGKITSTVVASQNALRGANQNMVRIDVEILGDKGNYTINGFKFNTKGTSAIADIQKATIIETDTTSTFFEAAKFGELDKVTANFSISGEYKVTLPGVYRFWLQYAIAPTAKVGNRIAVTPSEVLTETDNVNKLTEPKQALTTIAEGFHGTYTIGTSSDANYPTFAAAIDAMKDGIDGPVVFEVESGVYEEAVIMPKITGTSATNTITFKSKTGNYDDVTITHNSYVAPNVPSDLKVESELGVWTNAGADYVTLEGITIMTLDITYPAVVKVKFNSEHFTIRNCHLVTEMSTDYSNDITVVDLYGRNMAGDNNDFFTIENSVIEGGHKGIHLGASWAYTPSYERGAKVINNKFMGQGSKSVYLEGQIDFSISNNTFVNDQTDKSGFYALDLRRCFGEVHLDANSFDLNLPKGATAIYLNYIDTKNAAQPSTIANNEIKMFCSGASSTYEGIRIGSDDCITENVFIAHNTIRFTGESTNSVLIYVNDVVKSNFQNNIMQNEAKGYTYRAYKTEYISGSTFSNNVLFTEGTAFANVNKTEIPTFEEWLTTSGEKDSFKEKVSFLSESVLEPAAAGSLLNGKPLAAVKVDLNGTQRNATTPTIGAYEFAEVTGNPVFTEGFPSVTRITHESAVASVKSDMSGKAFVLCKLATEAAPTLEELLASTSVKEIRKNNLAEILITGLSELTEYNIYFLVQNLRGANSEIVKSETFKTKYLPTKVSTFEEVIPAEGGSFVDGTAKFTNFTVEVVQDAPGIGNHAAKVGTSSDITLTNTDKGINLTGFFLKADNNVVMTITDEKAVNHEYTLNATNNNWLFINLKDKGLITKVNMAVATGSAWIDDFSGEPAQLDVYVPNAKGNEGEEVTLTANPTTGVGPYTYVWENAMHEVVGNEASYKFNAKHTTTYKVTVTDAWGKVDSDNVEVMVKGNAYTATFEDFYLPKAESFWNGDGPDDTTGNGVFSTLYSGSYTFSVNRHANTWWSGHACSNQTSTDYATLEDQYRSAAGGGYNSNNYCVSFVDSYSGPHAMYVTNAEVDSIQGMYVTNTAWVKDAILNGDGMSTVPGGFAKGDYFKLIVKGQGIDNNFKEVEFYLADYRDEDEANHYLIDTWQWIDLRPLGKVKKIVYDLQSTKANDWGMTTPSYFCMDDVNGSRVIEKATEQLVGLTPVEIDLSQFVDFTGTAKVTYKVTDKYDSSIAEFSIINNKMTVTAKLDNTNTSVIISATQKGITKFIEIPVRINEYDAGINGTQVSNCRIYPIPAKDFVNVATDMDDYSVEILTTSGASVLYTAGNNGNVTIPLNLEQGVYVIRISNHTQTVVKQILVK